MVQRGDSYYPNMPSPRGYDRLLLASPADPMESGIVCEGIRRLAVLTNQPKAPTVTPTFLSVFSVAFTVILNLNPKFGEMEPVTKQSNSCSYHSEGIA